MNDTHFILVVHSFASFQVIECDVYILDPLPLCLCAVTVFWPAVLCYGCLFSFYFEMEGFHPSEGAG